MIALGSNQASDAGGPENTVRMAFDLLREEGINVRKISGLYQTPCFPKGAGPNFVNAAATIMCDLSPNRLLTLLHLIETRLGRVRDMRWGARTLDIDLIGIGDRILPDLATYRHWADLPADQQSSAAPEQLILPHPRMQDRAFVLIPLAEVAPDWVHPVLRLSVAEMVRNLSKSAVEEVKPL